MTDWNIFHNLEQFQNSFTMVMSGMRKVPSEETLRYIYYEAIKREKMLSEDIAISTVCRKMAVVTDLLLF